MEGEQWPFREVKSQGRKGVRREYQPPAELLPRIEAALKAREAGQPAVQAVGESQRPAPDMERAIEALANPRDYVVRDQAAHPYEAPDYALLEVLIRFAEGRLTRKITPTLLDKVGQVVNVWSPVAAARPDLAARLARIKASVDLLRLSEDQ